MRVLVYTDLQATEGAELCRGQSNVPLQRYRTAKFFIEAEKIARAHSVDAIWDLGDTLDNRSEIPVPTIQVTEAGLRWLMQGKPSTLCYKLIGNHEQQQKALGVHTGALFNPFFCVVPGCAVFDWGKIEKDGPLIIAVAFPYDTKATEEWLRNAIVRGRQVDRNIIILAHIPLIGAKMSSGMATGGLDPACLEGADLALMGHIHKHQEVRPNYWYLGSPFQQDFGEAGDPKYVAILDTQTLKLEFIPLDGFPQYRVGEAANMPSNLDLREDRWKVFVRTREQAQRMYATPWAAEVSEITYLYEETATRDASVGVLASEPSAMVEEYLKSHPNPGLKEDKLLTLGLQLLNGV